MAHCLVTLFRLSTFEYPDIPWNRQRVREELDFGKIVQLIVDRFAQVPQASGLELSPRIIHIIEHGTESEQPWFHTMGRIMVLRSLWEAKVTAMTLAEAEKESGRLSNDNEAMVGLGGPSMHHMEPMDFGVMNIDMSDDSWIRDMLGGGYDLGF
jgi:hypothetical protein